MEPLDIQAFARSLHEILVLAALRDGPRHGYQVVLDLEAASGGAIVVQHGTLYPLLHRLEAAGEVRGRWEEEGGRRRKVYSITPAGQSRLEADAVRSRELFERVLRILGAAPGTAGEVGADGQRSAGA